MKVCSKCDIEKPLEAFNRHPLGAHGRHPRCKECRSKDNAVRYKIVGPKKKDQKRERLYRYHITMEQFEAMVCSHKGRCGICKKERPLVIDHCHENGAIRGLLCQKCNQGLGKLGDNVEGIRAALTYLEK